MSEKTRNEGIYLKQYISEKEYEEIRELESISYAKDKTNLKLELRYKLNRERNSEIGLKEMNEFLYYIDENLVAYLGISSFGGSNIAEINGMTHPDFRRKGIFKKLFEFAMQECKKRNFTKVLLLSNGKSGSGVHFIQSVHGEYEFAEHRMKFCGKAPLEEGNEIALRKATNQDGKEIVRQNAIFFNFPEEGECFPEREEERNKITYMAELNHNIIGKLTITYGASSAFITGVGILPEYRGKGYGKLALKKALHIMNENNIYEAGLDVECKNSTALQLYKACGFEEVSVMEYYKKEL